MSADELAALRIEPDTGPVARRVSHAVSASREQATVIGAASPVVGRLMS